MADEKKLVDVSQTPTPMIDRSAPVSDNKIPMNLLPVEQVPVEQVPAEQPVEQTPPTEPPVVVPPIVSDIDPYTGKSWKELALEEKRKREELADRLPQMIDEKLSKINQPTQPTYTFEQLEVFKAQQQAALMTDPNAANAIAWATAEQRKMQQAENKKLFEEVVTGREAISKTEVIKERSLIQVQNEYPEAFNHDAQGRPISWNVTAPITQHIFQIMKDPRFANQADGLVGAAEMAYGRLAKSQLPTLQKQTQQAKADVKQAQKATLTEGAGRRIQPNAPPHQTAVDTLRKTGHIKDAETAMGAVLRARGIIVD